MDGLDVLDNMENLPFLLRRQEVARKAHMGNYLDGLDVRDIIFYMWLIYFRMQYIVRKIHIVNYWEGRDIRDIVDVYLPLFRMR